VNRLSKFAVALAAATALLTAAPASAHFEWRDYSWNDGCLSWVDPISAIFYGNGDIDRIRNHINHHAGWGESSGGGDQYFMDHGSCQGIDAERASGSFWESRYHIRLNQNADWDATFGYASWGTPHYEDIVGGCHAVRETVNGWSGFDMGRAELYYTLSPGHYTFTENWGNTAWMQQCDGAFAYSNGTVRFFWIPWEYH
jgi:hypothetical protein